METSETISPLRKNLSTILVAAILGITLVVYLFSYQVPANAVGVVFRLGKFRSVDAEPGLKIKWPAPIETVRKLDMRMRLFETKKQEAQTRDKNNLVVTITTGWHITDPKTFIERLKNEAGAEKNIVALVDSARNKALGEFYLHDLIHPDFEQQQKRFAAFESRMRHYLDAELLKADWGVSVDFLAVKQMIFPETVSEKVFARMKAEREKESRRYRTEGDSEAKRIVSGAEAEAQKTLAAARAEAEILRGKADAEAAEHYKVFKKNPDLANYLREIKALRKILASGKVTPVLDASRHAPFTLLEEDAAPEIK